MALPHTSAIAPTYCWTPSGAYTQLFVPSVVSFTLLGSMTAKTPSVSINVCAHSADESRTMSAAAMRLSMQDAHSVAPAPWRANNRAAKLVIRAARIMVAWWDTGAIGFRPAATCELIVTNIFNHGGSLRAQRCMWWRCEHRTWQKRRRVAPSGAFRVHHVLVRVNLRPNIIQVADHKSELVLCADRRPIRQWTSDTESKA